MTARQNGCGASRWSQRTAWGLLLLWIAGLGFVALRLRVEYWDGFRYLSNARLIAGQAADVGPPYSHLRPPLLPLLLAPLQLLLRPCGASLWMAHLLSVSISALGVLVVFRLFRRALGFEASVLGAALIACNALTVHYAPFVMADLLSMALAALALQGWLAARQSPGMRGFVLSGASAGLGAAAKFPVGLVVVVLLLFELIRAAVPDSRRADGRARLRALTRAGPWVGGVMAAATFFVVWWTAGALAARPESLDLSAVWAGTRDDLRLDAVYLDPWWEYLETCWILLGPVVIACGAVGFVTCLVSRGDDEWLHVLWALSYFLGISFIGHKEARYLLPLLPSIAFLALRGAEALASRVQDRRVRWLGAAALLAFPAAGGAREALRFGAPVYRQPLLAEAAGHALEEIGPSGRVMVTGGKAWTLFSSDPVVFPHDDFFHFHHVPRNGFEYFLGRKLSPVDAPEVPGVDAFFALPPGWSETRNAAELPPMPGPLSVWLRRVEELRLEEVDGETATYGVAPRRVILRKGSPRWTVLETPPDAQLRIGDGLPPSTVLLVELEERVFSYRTTSGAL